MSPRSEERKDERKKKHSHRSLSQSIVLIAPEHTYRVLYRAIYREEGLTRQPLFFKLTLCCCSLFVGAAYIIPTGTHSHLLIASVAVIADTVPLLRVLLPARPDIRERLWVPCRKAIEKSSPKALGERPGCFFRFNQQAKSCLYSTALRYYIYHGERSIRQAQQPPPAQC
jgi:hypothetical protein